MQHIEINNWIIAIIIIIIIIRLDSSHSFYWHANYPTKK
jgi:uncharacterized protein YpmB